MKYLLSPDGLRALDKLCRTQSLFAFDFDGTLAPIVSRRADAVIPASTLHLLKQLRSLVPVAIVSGRHLKDLRARLTVRPTYMIGNHGIENPTATRDTLRLAHRLCAKWIAVLRATLKVGLNHVDIEDKYYSLALHYRVVPDRAQTRRALLRAVRALTPAPRIVPGKMVINLLPLNAPDKGQAVQQLLHDTKIQQTLFIGDDVTDEDVFALRDRRIVCVRVGKTRSSHARYYLRTQKEINFVLQYLVQRLRTTTLEPRRK